MIVQIQATAVQLSQSEILEAVGQSQLDQIKKVNDKPFFVAYTVIQEGVSKPKVINGETKPIFWPKSVVEKTKAVIKKGLQFFAGHNSDSSHVGRTPLGQVVGSLQKVVNGKLSQIVIGYFKDKNIVKDYDICSIEAKVGVRPIDSRSEEAVYVNSLTGIALANRKQEAPGFNGAVRLASLQCFEDENLNNPGNGNNKPPLEKGNKTMTYEEFMGAPFDYFSRAMKDKNVFPSQLFKEDDIRNDRTFRDVFDNNATMDAKIKALETELNTKNTELATTQKDLMKKGSNDLLKSLLPQGLTDKQLKFIETKFNPDRLEDLSENGLKQFIDEAQNEYKEVAKVFGENTESTPGEGEQSDDVSVDKNDVETSVLNEIMGEE